MRVALVIMGVTAVCDRLAPCAAITAYGRGTAAFLCIGARTTFRSPCIGRPGRFGSIA